MNQRAWILAGVLFLVTALPTRVPAEPILSTTAQTCHGPSSLLAPRQTVALTCPVTSPLGGSKMIILPEMWVPGNGCIVTADKPRVVVVGNNFAVNATLVNRCGSAYKASEGGLGWIIHQIAP
jgi:hypothetical protein